MKKLATVLYGLLLAAPVYADPVTLKYQPPTERTDGKPIQPGELIEYHFDCLNSDFQSVKWPAGESSHVVEIPPGDWQCQLRVSNAVDWSAWSNVAEYHVAEPAPEPAKAPPNAPLLGD